MEIRKFKERVSLINQVSPNAPIQHLGWMTIERTLRINDRGCLRRTKTPNRLISLEVESQEIPLNVDFSIAVFKEFFPGFTGFGKASFSEVEEYLKLQEETAKDGKR